MGRNLCSWSLMAMVMVNVSFLDLLTDLSELYGITGQSKEGLVSYQTIVRNISASSRSIGMVSEL